MCIFSLIRQLKPTLFTVLIYLIAGVIFFGCISQKKMRRDITTQLKNKGTMRPYIAQGILDARPEFVLELLINRLQNQGARVLYWDKKDGVVSWCDTGGNYVPLPGMSDELQTHGLVSGQVTFWGGFLN